MTDGDFTGGYVDDEGYAVAPSEYAEQDTPQGYSDYDGTEYADKHDDGEQSVSESYEEIAERVAALEDAQAAYDEVDREQDDYDAPGGGGERAYLAASEADWERQRAGLERGLGRPLLRVEIDGMQRHLMNDLTLGRDVDLYDALARTWDESGGRIDDPERGRSGADQYWAARARDVSNGGGDEEPTQAKLDKLVAQMDSDNPLIRNQAEAEIMALQIRGLVEVEW